MNIINNLLKGDDIYGKDSSRLSKWEQILSTMPISYDTWIYYSA
jgi:hypothetical protein